MEADSARRHHDWLDAVGMGRRRYAEESTDAGFRDIFEISPMLESQNFRTSRVIPTHPISDPIDAARELRAAGLPQQALEAISGPAQFSADLYNFRGDLQLELGQIEEAARTYAVVIDYEPGNRSAHFNLARCLLRQNRWDAAAKTLQKLLAHDPQRDHVRIRLAECLLHLNRLEEALDCFDQCRSEPVRAAALFGKAVVLQLLRRFDEAEIIYERVLEINPAAEEALSNLIAMSMEVFDLRRIHRYGTRLLEVNSQSRIALQGLALVAIERREDETAARHFSRLLDQAIGAEVIEDNDAIEYRLSREVVERLNKARSERVAPPGERS
jgi:tetratricopeptide (TPR) repeat protein